MEPIGFWARLWLAIALPWRVLFDRGFATRVEVARRTAALPPESAASRGELAATEPTTTHAEPEPDHTAALLLLAILQREGRLIDFLQEDVAAFSDADVGAAARVVHEGCKRGLADYVEIEPSLASLVHDASRSADVGIREGGDILLEEVDQAPLALQDR